MNKVFPTCSHFRFKLLFYSFLVLGLGQNPLFAQRIQLANKPDLTPEIIEKSPVVSWDGKVMAFISNKGGTWGVYTATLSERGLWSDIKPIKAFQEYSQSNGTLQSLSMNYDGSRMYFAANFENDGGGMNIYYIDRIDDTWGQPFKLDKPINTEGYDGSPSITPDERTLYFVRTNPDAENKDYACKAIYVAYKNARGRWGKPSLLPYPINQECEECPTVSADGKTLFFSSIRKYKDEQGREAKDGYDLYYTKRIGERNWVNPVILDSLNTDDDELYPSVSAFGEVLYYSSGDEKKKNPKKRFGSVYMGLLPAAARPVSNLLLTGKVSHLHSKKPVSAIITVRNPYTAELIANFKNDPSSGDYAIFLASGNTYEVDIHQKGYSHQFFQYDLKQLRENKEQKQDAKIYSTVTLILNIFDQELFETLPSTIKVLNKDTQKEESAAKVKTLAKGRYELTLPIGKPYLFKVSSQHYSPIEYAFDMREVVQFSEYEKDLTLKIRKKEVKLSITDSETKAGLDSALQVKNAVRRESIQLQKLKDKGVYMISFREGDKYELKFHPRGYSFKEMTLAVNADTPSELKIALNPIKEEKTIVLNNIVFEINSADLEASSFTELDKVVDFMSENQEISIELSAHTDDQGHPAYNLLLSEKRAESVKNYLINKGIATERLTSKGYGETSPLVENTSKENRAKNRRVEMKIVKVE